MGVPTIVNEAISYVSDKFPDVKEPLGNKNYMQEILENKDFDFMVIFFMNKKNLWNMTFYTAKSNIDVSLIAKEFGGGGHAKAAGASSLKELPDFLKNGKPWSKPQQAYEYCVGVKKSLKLYSLRDFLYKRYSLYLV